MKYPLDWRSTTIGDVTLGANIWNPATQPRVSLNYVDVSAISRDKLAIESSTRYVAADAPSRARKVIRYKDTIFATIRPGLRRIAQVPAHLDNEITSTAFCVIRPNCQVVDPDFLFFAVNTDEVVDAVRSLETGASYPAVRDNDVFGQIIPLPPLDEQVRIAGALRTVRASVLHQMESLWKTQRLKATTMRELFTRGLRGEAQKETKIGLLPESWEVLPLTAVCSIRSGGTPPKSDSALWSGTFPWVSGKDLKVNRLADSVDHITAEAAETYSKITPMGAVLVLVRGMGLAKGFALSLIERPMAFNQDLKALVPGERITSAFLMHALTHAGERMLRNVADGAEGQPC